MSKLKPVIQRLTGQDGRGEADVEGDPARADARNTNGGEYVGRVAEDEDFSGETGAERRAGDGGSSG
jgi:hypothetical protein